MSEVSVLLSVWNGMPYLPLTVDSVLRQSFADFEFVINDNGSTDGSLEYLREMAARDSRIKILSDGSNHGHSGGLNRGLAECRGLWTARIDADDICLPDRLDRQLAFVREHPDLGAAASLAYYIDKDGKRVARTYSDLKTHEDFQRYRNGNDAIGLIHPSVILRTDLIRKLGGYRAAFGAANDMDLWGRIAESGAIILVQQEFLIEYRIHSGQESARRFFEARTSYEWSRACAAARRQGSAEPTQSEFLTQLAAQPLGTRINRRRKTLAKYYYRQGGLNWVCGSPVRGVLQMIAASCLQPSYAIHRFINQRLPGT